MPLATRKHKNVSIVCSVCKKSRCHSKYRRHLFTHARNGEIALNNVYKLLFKVRIPRRDMKHGNIRNTQSGYECLYQNELNVECKHIVLNLQHHLVSVHKLDKFSMKFNELMAESLIKKPLKRLSTVCGVLTSETQSNPTILSDQSDNTSSYMNISVGACVDTQGFTHESFDEPYSFHNESDSESLVDNEVKEGPSLTMSTPVTSFPQLHSTSTSNIRFIDNEKVISEFHSFLLTKGGGGRRNTPIKGDISSFRSLIKELGWDNLWDPSKLNHYISSATCSPSTLYCRLRVYERFINFLRMQIPSFLPSLEHLKVIEVMLSNLKEAIGKDRHLRSKHTMTVSRERMPLSFDVLRSWRSARAFVEVKEYFLLLHEKNNNLTESLFRQLRNYLIVEIILANAQRSGIIEGMLIKEVLKAKSNVTGDRLHYLYVENHKTGCLQPAIIYLEAEIYNFLFTLVTIVIPLLPCIERSRTDANCHVFQTWTSDRLRTSTISNCLRIGLKLFGIDDPKGCPTNYRKAASTLISMHKPAMQESLSQFMCHSRSTTERHYRHHMSHRGLSSVFNDLAHCQGLSSEEVGDISSNEHHTELSTITNDQLFTCAVNTIDENLPTCSDLSKQNEVLETNNDLDDTIASIFEYSINISSESDESCLNENPTHPQTNTSGLSSLPETINLNQSTIISPNSNSSNLTNVSRYACKRNSKSIFVDQYQEDTFFFTFDSLIEKALHHKPVASSDVYKLAYNSERFRPLWDHLITNFGDQLALKKVTDKIRTFARNNRKDFTL